VHCHRIVRSMCKMSVGSGKSTGKLLQVARASSFLHPSFCYRNCNAFYEPIALLCHRDRIRIKVDVPSQSISLEKELFQVHLAIANSRERKKKRRACKVQAR